MPLLLWRTAAAGFLSSRRSCWSPRGDYLSARAETARCVAIVAPINTSGCGIAFKPRQGRSRDGAWHQGRQGAKMWHSRQRENAQRYLRRPSPEKTTPGVGSLCSPLAPHHPRFVWHPTLTRVWRCRSLVRRIFCSCSSTSVGHRA